MSVSVSPSKSKVVKRFPYASIKATEAAEANGNDSHFFSLADLSSIPKSGPSFATLKGIKLLPSADNLGSSDDPTKPVNHLPIHTAHSAPFESGENLSVPYTHHGEQQQSEPPSLGSSIVSSPPTPTFEPNENVDLMNLDVANAYPPTWLI